MIRTLIIRVSAGVASEAHSLIRITTPFYPPHPPLGRLSPRDISGTVRLDRSCAKFYVRVVLDYHERRQQYMSGRDTFLARLIRTWLHFPLHLT
jgi:hypothetical protein